jgi:hypothetical protein
MHADNWTGQRSTITRDRAPASVRVPVSAFVREPGFPIARAVVTHEGRHSCLPPAWPTIGLSERETVLRRLEGKRLSVQHQSGADLDPAVGGAPEGL